KDAGLQETAAVGPQRPLEISTSDSHAPLGAHADLPLGTALGLSTDIVAGAQGRGQGESAQRNSRLQVRTVPPRCINRPRAPPPAAAAAWPPRAAAGPGRAAGPPPSASAAPGRSGGGRRASEWRRSLPRGSERLLAHTAGGRTSGLDLRTLRAARVA